MSLFFFLSLVAAVPATSSFSFFSLLSLPLCPFLSLVFLFADGDGVLLYIPVWLQTCYVLQAGPELEILLLLSPCYYYRHVPSYLVLIPLLTSNMYMYVFS